MSIRSGEKLQQAYTYQASDNTLDASDTSMLVLSGSRKVLETAPSSTNKAYLLALSFPKNLEASNNKSCSLWKAPAGSAKKRTWLVPTFSNNFSPNAFCTNASFTATTKNDWYPFSLKPRKFLMKPGTCDAVQPGENAPGIPTMTDLPSLVSSARLTVFPGEPSKSSMEEILSPTATNAGADEWKVRPKRATCGLVVLRACNMFMKNSVWVHKGNGLLYSAFARTCNC